MDKPRTLLRNPARLKRKSKHAAGSLLRYFLLIGVGVVFLYPILYMIVNSFKNVTDLVNPTIEWVPSSLYIGNFRKALQVLDYGRSFVFTLLLVTAATLLQTLCCSLAGYALAVTAFLSRGCGRHDRRHLHHPDPVTLIPKYLLYTTYHLVDSPLAVLVPSAFGQGVNSAIFILVFYQFFSSYPKSFDEAAQMDGAGLWKVFFRIALPICVPAVIISLLFSFVWTWNETYTSGTLMGKSFRTLPMKLASFVESYNTAYSSGTAGLSRLNEGIRLSATCWSSPPCSLCTWCCSGSLSKASSPPDSQENNRIHSKHPRPPGGRGCLPKSKTVRYERQLLNGLLGPGESVVHHQNILTVP